MNSIELLIGRTLRIGLWLSVIVVFIGGLLYLIQNGQNPVNYSTLATSTVQPIWKDIFTFTPVGIIQLGLIILICTQIVRVAMTAWLFIKESDLIFTVISLAILIVLLGSLWIA